MYSIDISVEQFLPESGFEPYISCFSYMLTEKAGDLRLKQEFFNIKTFMGTEFKITLNPVNTINIK